jgi:hypothetical protein
MPKVRHKGDPQSNSTCIHDTLWIIWILKNKGLPLSIILESVLAFHYCYTTGYENTFKFSCADHLSCEHGIALQKLKRRRANNKI